MMIEIDKDGDGNDIENGIDERRRNEIPLVSINTPVFAKIVRFLECNGKLPHEMVNGVVTCVKAKPVKNYPVKTKKCKKCGI